MKTCGSVSYVFLEKLSINLVSWHLRFLDFFFTKSWTVSSNIRLNLQRYQTRDNYESTNSIFKYSLEYLAVTTNFCFSDPQKLEFV